LALSCESCGTPPWTPPDGHRFPDMLCSPSGFRFRVSQATQEPPSEFIPTAPGIQRSASRRTPDMRFSLIRLSPGQSTGRIPRRHSGWPPVPATHEAPRQLDSVLTVAVAHPARGPSLRRVVLSTPILATTPSSDFRSTLHHFAGHAYRFRCYRSTRRRHPPGPLLPVSRRISPVPRWAV
jgi:hypothetical protein